MTQNSQIRYTWDTREFRVLQYLEICFMGVNMQSQIYSSGDVMNYTFISKLVNKGI